MGPLALAYTTATAVMFGVCVLARHLTPDAERVARAAAWVALFTGLSRVVHFFVPPPWSMVHYPAEDLAMLTLAFSCWHVRHERWALLLAGLFLSQLFLHALYWFDPASSLRGYIIANNALFIAQLVTLTVAGGGYALGRLRHRLHELRRWPGDRVWRGEAAQA
jgi:hypothetical protein